MGAVVETDVEGFSYCNGHRNRRQAGYLAEMKAEITDKGIDKLIKKAGIGAKDGKTPQRSVEAIDQALGYHLPVQEIEKLTNVPLGVVNPRQDGHKIKFLPGGFKHGETSQYAGVDFDYYSKDYKNDHIYLVDQAIRFAYGKVHILYQQLERIEEEEEQLKVTERRGSQMSDGEVIDFDNTEIRHVTPYEVKIKLFDSMTKAEAHLASLLKQKEQLLVTCLNVLRKLNIKFSREAGQLVVAAIDRKIIEQATDSTPLPLQHGYLLPERIMDEAMNEVHELRDGIDFLEAGPKVHRVSKEMLQKAHELNEENVEKQVYAPTPEEMTPFVDDDW